MRILFMGSPDEVIPILKELETLKQTGYLKYLAVVSQPAKPSGRKKKLVDPPVAVYSKDKGLPLHQPVKASSPEFLEIFRELAIDTVITAAYGQMLSDNFLAIPKLATINFHPSKLPKYRGASPVQSALFKGEGSTALTVLYTIKKMDAGNIILQENLPIGENETAAELLPRSFQFGATLVKKALELVSDPNFSGTPQNENDVTHCTKFTKDDGKVFWDNDGHEIYNQYRAFIMWPGSYSFISGKRIVLSQMKLSSERSLTPGKISYDKKNKVIIVGTGGCNLHLLKLKPEGSKEQSADAFWNGLKQADKKEFYFDSE